MKWLHSFDKDSIQEANYSICSLFRYANTPRTEFTENVSCLCDTNSYVQRKAIALVCAAERKNH